MKKVISLGAFYCPLCSARLNSGSNVCPTCGADTDDINLFDRWPVVNRGKGLARRRKAAYRLKEVLYKLLFGAALAWGVPQLLFATGQLSHNDEGRMVSTVLAAMFMGIAVIYSLLGLMGILKTYQYRISIWQKGCLICGSANDKRSMYCIKCGCELPHTDTVSVPSRRTRDSSAPASAGKSRPAFCRHCGKRLTGGNFCENCGARVN